jgi:hypothetical protein
MQLSSYKKSCKSHENKAYCLAAFAAFSINYSKGKKNLITV